MSKFSTCTVRYGTVLMPTAIKDLPVLALNEASIGRVPLMPDRRQKLENRYKKEKVKQMSISALLGATGDNKQLYIWQKQKMDEMGITGFRAFMSDRLSQGIKMHSIIASVLAAIKERGSICPEEVDEMIPKNTPKIVSQYIKSVRPFLVDLQNPEEIAVERAVSHPLLGYHGRFDAVLKYKDALCMIDWKTSAVGSNFHKYGRDSMSFPSYSQQAAAYTSAFNHDPTYFENSLISHALIVSAKEDGSPAEVFDLNTSDLTENFSAFKEQLGVFWAKVRSSGKRVDFAYDPVKDPSYVAQSQPASISRTLTRNYRH